VAENAAAILLIAGDSGMSDKPLFLRPDVIVEPLVDGFYTRPHTVAPAQAAMNLVRDLLTSIKRDRTELLEFAAAIAEADEIMRQGATGFDLTPLYPKLPAVLAGMVELVYDTNNHPSMRYIGPLAYKSSARVQAATLGRLREVPELDEQQAAGPSRLLAEEPDLAGDHHIDGEGRIRYFGHARLVLPTPEAAVVIDPWVSCVRHGRGGLAGRPRHGHQPCRGLESAQAGGGVHDLVRW
jgi:Diiron non-heme beta-hydroxylase N-terminal domain